MTSINIPRSKILLVEADGSLRHANQAHLAREFEVTAVDAGKAALAVFTQMDPDLVILDTPLPDLDCIDLCQRLLETSDVPVLFVTGSNSLTEHLRAYDAGCQDVLTKPVPARILAHRARALIARHRQARQLGQEKLELQSMAMNFRATASQSGALLNFMRSSADCRTYVDLASRLVACLADLGADASVMLRHAPDLTIMTTHGPAAPREVSVLARVSEMGRVFQFKSRLAVNYPQVSIIVANMPAEAAAADLLRDNVISLAEITEALCENVEMRLKSAQRAEQLQMGVGSATQMVSHLRSKYHGMLLDVRLRMHELVEQVDRRIHLLGASQREEAELHEELDTRVQEIQAMLAEGSAFEAEFDKVLAAMRGGCSQDNVELF